VREASVLTGARENRVKEASDRNKGGRKTERMGRVKEAPANLKTTVIINAAPP
jgi:hypothetical protein